MDKLFWIVKYFRISYAFLCSPYEVNLNLESWIAEFKISVIFLFLKPILSVCIYHNFPLYIFKLNLRKYQHIYFID